MHTQEIRRHFLKFFKDRQHAVVPSSPVVPHDDPTLLFTNAGMNQFKDVFLGKSVRSYKTAASSQKCIRVGGKHNDLENVGHTSRHLTFFEMLGNFSFGDYFKEKAIHFAWEVSTQVFGFSEDRIWPSVFRDDDEAFEIWKKFVPAERITRLGEKDNFWEMGDTGPCGPCSELYYDRGPAYGAAANLAEDVTGERYLEYWNLVFMQFNTMPGGLREPLPKPSIDTGAGLERIISLKMGVDTVFETDVLRSIIDQIEELSSVPYKLDDQEKGPAFRVIADHLRCLAFAIADGVQPSNLDRGYVLRKVLRRAVRYGKVLGFEKPFLSDVLPRLVDLMGGDYPELVASQTRIAEILAGEEEAFIRTLKRGGNILNQIIQNAKKQGSCISGEDAFKLKDTYGLPLDEITLLAKDDGLVVDQEKYAFLEEEAKTRSRSAQKTVQQIAGKNIYETFTHTPSTFLGYAQDESEGTIKALVVQNAFVDQIGEGQEAVIVLDQTPFYAEMGGQVGDIGIISSGLQHFDVHNTYSPYQGVIAHIGKMKKGTLKVGEVITATVDSERKRKISNNHTATHLLHWALEKVLGPHIKQAGSVVDPTRLRFDFSHHKAVTHDELRQIEDLVNQKIRANSSVDWYELDYEEVQKRQDIKQFFGEKYDHIVRVIDIDYSKELCGGVHTSATGNIGYFRILKESSISAGVRRIEAVTGEEAMQIAWQHDDQLSKLAAILKTQPGQLGEKIDQLLQEKTQLEGKLIDLKKEQMGQIAAQLIEQQEVIKDTLLITGFWEFPVADLKVLADVTMGKIGSGVLAIGTIDQGKCHLLIRISDNLVKKGFDANRLIKNIAPIIEGSGGGKPENAQAGGKALEKLPAALEKIKELIAEC